MKYQIITFYEFKPLDDLGEIKARLKSLMTNYEIFGTFIIAPEGFNAMITGYEKNISRAIPEIEAIFQTKLSYKASYDTHRVFRRQKVKIKKEIVTLRKKVDFAKGKGTHIAASKWNEILDDPDTVVLDARNFYEVEVGTFSGAINPETRVFNELPEFVEINLDPKAHKKIAMFCTGGIRCEKFAPYLIDQGFDEVCQLEGGILHYLEEIPEEESLWKGECFVFDERITVDEKLDPGRADDISMRKTK